MNTKTNPAGGVSEHTPTYQPNESSSVVCESETTPTVDNEERSWTRNATETSDFLQQLANRILDGHRLGEIEAAELLKIPSQHLLALLDSSYRIRSHYFGNQVFLNYLVNAKSGLCPEDCSYCSQAKGSEAEIAKYKMMTTQEMVDRAEQAVNSGASTCCLVISGRGPSAREVNAVSEASRQIKEKWPELKICACLGILKDQQAEALKESGVDRYNHNLNTAPEIYKDICSTHTYLDRKNTVKKSSEGGLSPCSGLIVGMNETDIQLVRTLIQLRELGVDSIPINFLVAIEGTPLGSGGPPLTPQRCLQILAVARFIIPDKEIRCSAGREKHLRHLQPMSLYPANSWFVSDYLTTSGQEKSIDHQMIKDLGFEIKWVGEAKAFAEDLEPELEESLSAGSCGQSCQGSCGH